MINFEYIQQLEAEIKTLLPQSLFFYPQNIDDIVKYIIHHGSIRLLCTRGVYKGDISVMENIAKVMKLLKANSFKYHEGDNFWLDLYYVPTDEEIKEIKKYSLLKQIDEL
jgi:hypothetical protein